MVTKKKDEDRFPVEVTEAERRQVHLGLKARTDAVKKEGTKLETLGLSKEAVQSSLAVLEGDGTNGGLLRRFGTRDQEDMFAEPKPEGAVDLFDPTLPAGSISDEQKEEGIKSFKSLDEIVEGIREGTIAIDKWDHGTIEDAGGQLFIMEVQVHLSLAKFGDRCKARIDQKEGDPVPCFMTALPDEHGLCQEHELERQKILQEEKEEAKKEAGGPQLMEGDATSVLDQKRFLALKKVENDLIPKAGDRDFEPLAFHVSVTDDMDFLDQFLAIDPEKVDLDHLPVLGAWNANDLKGVKFVGKGRMTAEEFCLCAVHFWHATASAKGGKFTKGDAEDIQSRLISWKAREDQKEE